VKVVHLSHDDDPRNTEARLGIELQGRDHSTLSRRLSKLVVKLPVVPKDEAVHVVVDSTLCESLW
jgi:hypothetical protein